MSATIAAELSSVVFFAWIAALLTLKILFVRFYYKCGKIRNVVSAAVLGVKRPL